uniref:Uncharacterized protein n=1 Tax=Panagrellus redivivus TaxID=6233 RepID=A0A7E4VHK4_PANRE
MHRCALKSEYSTSQANEPQIRQHQHCFNPYSKDIHITETGSVSNLGNVLPQLADFLLCMLSRVAVTALVFDSISATLLRF